MKPKVSGKTVDENLKHLLEQPSVPHLREGKSGDFEIKIETIPVGKKMTVVSMRNWVLMGYKPLKCSFDNPRPLYKLLKKGRLLMSDSPQELFLQYEAYKEARGNILIGGLGLGMTPTLLAKKKDVKKITVVEIEKDVIKLCNPRNKKIRVVNDDIRKFILSTKEKFDFIYIDIHYSTGVTEYISTVLPMRKLLTRRFPDTPSMFWGEEEMKTQYDPDYDKWGGA